MKSNLILEEESQMTAVVHSILAPLGYAVLPTATEVDARATAEWKQFSGSSGR
jgi:hypothetical protein